MHKKILIAAYCLGSLCTSFFELKGQTPKDSSKTYQLQEVEVSANARHSTSKSGTLVQILNKEDIDKLGIQSISDALRRFSGLTVKDYGGIGGLKTVSIRSLGAQHTAIAYDGIVVGDAQSGQVDIGRFSLENVDMLSLTLGQSDNIFQSARILASAGALNISTQKANFADEKYTGKAQIKTGSFGFFQPSIILAHKLGKKSSVSLFSNLQRADGNYPFALKNIESSTREKRYNSDVLTNNNELNIASDFGRKGYLNIKTYYSYSERGLPGAVTLYNPYSGERLWDKIFFSQSQYENKLSKIFTLKSQFKYQYAYTKYQDIDNKYENGKIENEYNQEEYYLANSILLTPHKNIKFSVAQDIIINLLDNNLSYNPMPRRYSSLSALSARYQSSNISLTTSLLATYITEEARQNNAKNNAPDDKKKLSPAVSLSYQPFSTTALRIRTSYKHIFRVPSFNDLYYEQIGNTNLKPESASQYNLGLSWVGSMGEKISYLNISADAYYNRVQDKIIALPRLFTWIMLNMGEVDIRGLDLNAASQIWATDKMTVQIMASYSYQKAIDITNRESKNYKHQIPYTPLHSGSASIALENNILNIAYNIIASGERYALPQNNESNKIKGFAEHGISINRTLKVQKYKLRLQGEILNLGNNNYQIIQYYPMPGRSFRISAGVVF